MNAFFLVSNLKIGLFFWKFWTDGVQKSTFRFWEDIKYFKSTTSIPLKAAYWKWTHFALTLTESQFMKYKGNIFFQGQLSLSTVTRWTNKHNGIMWQEEVIIPDAEWLETWWLQRQEKGEMISFAGCSVAELKILPVTTCCGLVSNTTLSLRHDIRETHMWP